MWLGQTLGIWSLAASETHDLFCHVVGWGNRPTVSSRSGGFCRPTQPATLRCVRNSHITLRNHILWSCLPSLITPYHPTFILLPSPSWSPLLLLLLHCGDAHNHICSPSPAPVPCPTGFTFGCRALGPPCPMLVPESCISLPIGWMLQQYTHFASVWLPTHYSVKYNNYSTDMQPFIHLHIFQQHNTMFKLGGPL